MPEISPELAEKVLSADLRNLIQKISSGGNLTVQERQMFLDFVGTQGGADDLQNARTNAMLRKWLRGNRLTEDERQEIAHILPEKGTEKSYEGTADDNAARLGLSRRAYFRWLGHGKEHNDPLPVDNPPAVPDWQERMRKRGVFKNRCPASVKAACSRKNHSAPLRPAPSVARLEAASGSAGSGGRSTSIFSIHASAERRDLHLQIDDLERHVEVLRLATETSLGKRSSEGDDEARQLITERTELLDKITTLRRRASDLDEREKRTVNKDEMREQILGKLRVTLASWMLHGRRFYGESGTTLPREKFIEIWQGTFRKFTEELVESGFAPPLELLPPAA